MRGVASVVEHHVGLPVVPGGDALVDAPPEVLLGLAPPGEHGDAVLGQGRGHLVLGRVDVASRPADLEASSHLSSNLNSLFSSSIREYLSTKRDESLDKDRRLGVDVGAPDDLGPDQGLVVLRGKKEQSV